MFSIRGTDKGGEAATEVSNGDGDSSNGTYGIREATNNDRVTRSIEIHLRARKKPNGVTPNTSELIALGGVQKELFATVLTTGGSKGGKEISGGTEIGSLRQGEALDGAIATAVDGGLARHGEGERKEVDEQEARSARGAGKEEEVAKELLVKYGGKTH